MRAGSTLHALKRSAVMVLLCGVCCFPVLVACFEDDFDTTISQENNYSESGELLPIPGNSGMISASDITDSGLTLAWSRASDEKTSQPELQYRVFRSDSSNIGTPSSAETNGSPLADWTVDATSISVSGLDSGKIYYFNVIVRAQDGRKAAYVMVSATTVGVVYLFAADGLHKGNLTTPFTASARADVDKICTPVISLSPMSMMVVAVPQVKNTRAFISINANDAIKDFPAHYGIPANWPVKSFWGNQVAWNWADLLDGSINMKLDPAGVVDTFWWSGSSSDGSYDTTNNCSGWTDGTNTFDGMTGAHNELSDEWISSNTRNCNNELKVLCVGW